MVRDLMDCGGAKLLVEYMPLPPSAEAFLVRQARLNSTHHSTQIEGNTLSKDAIRRVVAGSDRKASEQELEVRNYWRALEWMEEQADQGRPVSEALIKSLHALIDTSSAGRKPRESQYRQTTIQVRDSETQAPVYIAPDWREVPDLMADLVAWALGPAALALPSPVRAALIAHRFLTIHPFHDGNGRTARALATYVLWTSGFRMRGFLSVEEQYANRRPAYYAAIQMGLPVLCYTIDERGESRLDCDHTQWLEFFCRTLAASCEALVASAKPWIQSLVSVSGSSEWERLDRRQQSVLVRLLDAGSKGEVGATVDTGMVMDWFGVSRPTALDWLGDWERRGFLTEVAGGKQRRFGLAEVWSEVGAQWKEREAQLGVKLGYGSSLNLS